MAKRRSRATTRGLSADRPQVGRRKTGYASGATPERGGRRMMSGARNLAGKVGKTTLGAAGTTIGVAREWAAGAAGVVGNVASRAGEMGSQVAGKVRENPWPTILIGAGATWLAVDAIRGRSEDTGRGRAGAGHRRGDRSAVGQAMSKVASAGRVAGEQIEEFVRDRPLLAGAATLGLGVAVGMAMPSSVTENRVFGETRDRIVSRARDAARGTIDKVRDVAQSVERLGSFGGGSPRGGSRG